MKLIGIVAGLLFAGISQADTCRLEFDNGSVLDNVPQVVTMQDMSAGLSNRDSAGQGMLFSWPEPALRVVWMKNTRIPLSVAYIDGAGVVLSILDLEPFSLEYRWSELPATDALEVARGEFQRMGIKAGSRLVN